MGLLDGRIAVVTGATSGIGEASAKLLAQEGAEVVLSGRNEERGLSVQKDIESRGGTARFIRCDVSEPSDVTRLSEIVAGAYGRVDVLFNNAGIFRPSMEIERMPVDDWKSTFAVNIDGMFYVTRALKDMIFKCRGCIINNASIAGMHSYVNGRSYAYSAAKSAVIQFTRQMAKNYGEDGVRVNCICPGIIDTPILGYKNKADYAKRVPLGYLGSPMDVAKVVLFLASDDAGYVTGAVLPVDGGVSC